MKRAFIRALWGIHDRSHRLIERRFRVDKNIQSIINNKFNEPFVVYVMGDESYDEIKSLGCNAIKICSEPYKFDLIKHQYRNKLEIIKYAVEEDKYDEIVYLDWDCFPQKKILSNFWDNLGKKEVFQGNLQVYHRKKAYWRTDELRKVPNGGFMYIRDKSLPSKAIKYWEELGMQDNDEPSWAKITDEMVGGWKGIDKYWDLFEPMCCNLHRSSPYPMDRLKQKDLFFIHYQGGR